MSPVPLSAADRSAMERALALAHRAAAQGEVPVGAVLQMQGETIAEAHNETIRRTDPLAHAEVIALRRALTALHTDRLPEATLYVTLEPCAQCAGAIVLAKVGRVVFGAWDPKAGMGGSVHDLLRHPRLNARPEILGGVMQEECGALLQEFFRARRT